MGRVASLLAGVLLVCIVVGCGGGDAIAPPQGTTGQVSGRVVGVGDPTEYTILVDGQPTDIQPGPSGDFLVPGLPPGPHTIGIVKGGAMQGIYLPAPVEPGQDTNIGDVTPELGGQIAGIVTRVLEDGTVEAVEGVEVTATAMVYWEPGDPGGTDPSEPVGIGRTGDPEQVVISAFTNANGSYLMEAVPVGGYDVMVVVPGYDPQVQWVWVDAGTTVATDFRVYPAPEQGVGTVEGIVTGAGAPLEGAMVTLTTRSPWPVPLPLEAVESWLDSRPGGGTMPCSVEDGC
ncbi:MAG: carboxypeptidase regulatory-like domain-containing protein, partial [Armatimonadetes bacterium]|nr:carboxypeptidase regulatory-like domain-containing protein [Armatimonadota bacterium]